MGRCRPLLNAVIILLTLNLVAIVTVHGNDVGTSTVSSGIGYKSRSNSNHTDEHSNNSTDHSGGHGNDTEHHDNTTHPHSEDGSHGGHASIHLASINFAAVKNPLVFGLVVILAGLSKIGFHHADFLSTKVPESCILILLGVVLGAIIHFSGIGKDMDFFQPHEFFMYLLPPIILEAAFSLHDRTFFENFGSIIMFSVVGTVIAWLALGLTLVGLMKAGAMTDPGCDPVQTLVFSALIVAVDPVAVLAIFQEVGVNNMLYFMVFGESLLNDGVTVVLYNVMQTYNRMDVISPDQIVLGFVKFFVVVFGGIVIGTVLGLLSSFLTKYTNSVKVVEPIIIFGFAYQSYILAEMFHFSGIISIIACGLIQMQYAFNNITNKSKLCCKFFAKVISNTCEIIIFMFLGLKVVNPDHEWNTGFTLWTTFFCIVYRFVITYGISFLINHLDRYRVRKIKLDEMFMISYGGLRGAVCFSLVALLNEKEFPMKDMFITTTLFVIFFTVFIQGGTIKWLVKKMRVSLAHSSKDMVLYMELQSHVSDHLMAGVEEIVGRSGKYYFREKFERLENRYIFPYFLRDPKRCEVGEINEYYEKLMMKEHYKNLRLCGVSHLPRVGSDLRQVDSSACLKILGDDEDEERALKRDEKIRDRRSRLISQQSMREAESPHGADLHKVFRNALVSNRERAGTRFHDKNLVSDTKRQMAGYLRNKYHKNARLSNLQSGSRAPFEHAQSLPETESDDVTLRAHAPLDAPMTARAHTVDYSHLARDSLQFSPGPLAFNLEDTVFEANETEEAAEGKPLLKKGNSLDVKENRVMSDNDSKHVTFGDTENGSGTGENDGKGALKGADSTDETGKGGRTDSRDTGHLLRQNALQVSEFGSDIQMQDLGKTKGDKTE